MYVSGECLRGAVQVGISQIKTECFNMPIRVSILIWLLLCSPFAHAENITLTDDAEIEKAEAVSTAMAAISDQVMKCIEDNNGNTDGCICATRESCPFKAEFDDFVEVFCGVIAEHPEWKERDVAYQISPDPTSHTLGTSNIHRHYGNACL